MAFSTLNSTPSRADGELCPSCGQLHQALDNHLYNFQDEVDDELMCNICLQPLLQPMDTPCGHTYCYCCLESFLQGSNFCPMDREPLMFSNCRRSTLLVRNLLDKLIVFCPFPPDCRLTMQRCELEGHLQNRCPGLKKYQAKIMEEKCQQEQKKQEVVPLEPEASSPGGENFFDIDPILSMDSEYSSVTTMVPWNGPEPGLVNPAFEETDEDSILNLSTSDLTRSNSLVAETVIVEISRDNPEKELGMRIVGGKDTPLGNIVVQEVHQDTPLGMDGKVAPGDHVLEVNGINISNVTHSQAISLLRQAGPVLQLVILQEKGFLNKPPQDDSPIPSRAGEIVHVTLMKKDRMQPLGIKLIRKAGKAGIFILDLLDGGLAAKNGKLSQNDKVLSINGQDLRQGTPETAAQIIQTSESRVHFVVLRPQGSLIMEMETESSSSGPSRSVGRSNESDGSSGTSNDISLSHGNGPSTSVSQWKPELGHYPRPLAFYKDPPDGFLSQEKTLTIRKDVKESLGITIGGGREGKHSVPIYVTSVQPVGCLCRESRIQRGNILLSINGLDLTSLSYQEAVSVLKSQAASTIIVLKTLDILIPPVSLEPWAGGQEPPIEYGPNWSPLWLSWLGLPSALHLCQDVVLHKNTDESWGFSIVGGFEVSKGNQPFFIKTIVPGTPAFRDRRLKCGDEIVAVNGTPAVGMSNAQLIPMLKELRNRVALTVVSWPGSLV